MLHARATAGAASWIISLVNDNNEICVLQICPNENDANQYVHQINSCIIPQQTSVIEKLSALQSILKRILDQTGLTPKSSEELVLAIQKTIRYIELGKSINENL